MPERSPPSLPPARAAGPSPPRSRMPAAPLLALLGLSLAVAGTDPASAQCERPGQTPEPGTLHREDLHGVDLGALDAAGQERALWILNANPCLCGCRHTLASCRVESPECERSRTLSAEVVRRITAGEADGAIQAYLRSQPIPPRPHRGREPAPAPGEPRPRPAPPSQALGPVLEDRAYTIPTEAAPARGPEDAPVTIVEFADFQCAFCAQSLPLLEEVLSVYRGRVRLVFKHFPLPSHARARDAAMAAIAAQAQGQFWPMHDLLFANRSALERTDLIRMARSLGLNAQRFESDLDSTDLQRRLEQDLNDGRAANLTGTPTFYVNGRKLMRLSRAAFRLAIEEALSGPGRPGLSAPSPAATPGSSRR